MPKIKEVYEYNNGSWENGTPIGADASNVDVALSDSTSTRDLQSVLGNVSVSDSSIKTQLSGKVDTDSGDIKDTVVSVLDPSSATDTSEDIDSTDVIVAAGEDQTTMWSKFNTFRKRVSNKFNNFLINSVEDVLEPSDTKTYSQAALNSYFADVIGYKTDADVASIGSVADQLSTLNNNAAQLGSITRPVYLGTSWAGDANVATLTYPGCLLCFYYFLTVNNYNVTTAYGHLYTMPNNWILAAPEKYIPDGGKYSVYGLTVSISGNGYDFATNIRYSKVTLSTDYTRGISFGWMNATSYTAVVGSTVFATVMFINN